MANEYKLSYTASEINDKLGKIADVDQDYNPNSTNAQSGVAVAEELLRYPVSEEGTDVQALIPGKLAVRVDVVLEADVGRVKIPKVGDLYYNTDEKVLYRCQSVESDASGGSISYTSQWSPVTAVGKETKEGGEIFNLYEPTDEEALGSILGDQQLPANVATGKYSHAEGISTAATGKGSHAEGAGTKADAEGAHAEGAGTLVTGAGAHAEGRGANFDIKVHTIDSTDSSIITVIFKEGFLTLIESNKYLSAIDRNTVLWSGNKFYYITELIETNTGSLSTPANLKIKLNEPFTGDVKSTLTVLLGAALSYMSHVEGNYNVTLDIDSTSLYSTESSKKQRQHAEGNRTLAIGYASHTEGDTTLALGSASHTEGNNTEAIADYSHAEGYGTKAIKIAAHAEGTQTEASGDYSHAQNANTIASGWASHAEGNETEASGDYSHAQGNQTKASGDYSHAEGYQTHAIGLGAHAEGKGFDDYSSGASGDYSHSEGYKTIASGDDSHSEGYKATASGDYSHAEGYITHATGSSSHAEGYDNTASGDYSHTEGKNTRARGLGAHAEGLGDGATGAFGDYSHSEGYKTTAKGHNSHSEGYKSTAENTEAHAEGYCTHAVGLHSHAEGDHTTAIGESSHAEGYSSEAIGDYSHAEGYGTKAGWGAHASGYGTRALYNSQTAIGRFNDNKKNTVFEVGYGSDEDVTDENGNIIEKNRKNVFEVYKDGYAKLETMGADDNSVAIKSYVDNSVNTLDNVLRDILTAIQSGSSATETIDAIEQTIVSYLENKTIAEVEE